MKSILLILIRFAGLAWCRLHGVRPGKRNLIQGLPRIRRKGGTITLGDDVTINSAGWSNPLNDGRRTVLHAGSGGRIVLEDGVGISSSRLISYHEIILGRRSLLGAGCLICDSDMHEVPLGSGNPVRTAAIHIGERVFIGAGCTILKGAVIGNGAVIGAGSVVSGQIEAGTLAAGNPARLVRRIE